MLFLNNLIHIQLYIQAIRQYQGHAMARGGAITFKSKKKFGQSEAWRLLKMTQQQWNSSRGLYVWPDNESDVLLNVTLEYKENT